MSTSRALVRFAAFSVAIAALPQTGCDASEPLVDAGVDLGRRDAAAPIVDAAPDSEATDGAAADRSAGDGKTADGARGDGRTGDGRSGDGAQRDGRTRTHDARSGDGAARDGRTGDGKAADARGRDGSGRDGSRPDAGPGPCGKVPFAGCCSAGTVRYCDTTARPMRVRTISCAKDPKCGWNSSLKLYDCGTSGAADPSGSNPLLCAGGV